MQPPAEASPNNPCPFLRALEALGYIRKEGEPLPRLGELLAAAAGGPPKQRSSIRRASQAIAAIASGLGPSAILRTIRKGLDVARLRNGPLDKRGVGSGILDASGNVSLVELKRLGTFAREFAKPEGSGREKGLGLAELRAMMDANFERAKGRRRPFDRKLMDGEWPVLLQVMGKSGPDGAYLALDEVEALFRDRVLPSRITDRIAAFREPGTVLPTP